MLFSSLSFLYVTVISPHIGIVVDFV